MHLKSNFCCCCYWRVSRLLHFFVEKKCLPPVKFNAHNLPPSLFTRFNTKSEYKGDTMMKEFHHIDFHKDYFHVEISKKFAIAKIMCHKWKFYQRHLYQSGIFHIFTFTYMIKWEYLANWSEKTHIMDENYYTRHIFRIRTSKYPSFLCGLIFQVDIASFSVDIWRKYVSITERWTKIWIVKKKPDAK